jgi:hypothetical protein
VLERCVADRVRARRDGFAGVDAPRPNNPSAAASLRANMLNAPELLMVDNAT